jgi:hypothetical protein
MAIEPGGGAVFLGVGLPRHASLHLSTPAKRQ